MNPVGLNVSTTAKKSLPTYGRRKLPAFPGYFVLLGPGVVWLAAAQGSGELIWWPYLAAKYGLTFVFLIIPACLLQYPVTVEIGRYSAYTGESIWVGFLRLNRVLAVLLFVGFVVSFIWFGGWASAGGTALAQLTHFPPGFSQRGQSLFWGCASILLLSSGLLVQKHPYRFVEWLMWCVAVVTFGGLLYACLQPGVLSRLPDFSRALLAPTREAFAVLDPADSEVLVTSIISAGMGGYWCLFFSFWIMGKGVAGCSAAGSAGALVEPQPNTRPGEVRRWKRFFLLEPGIGIVGNLLTTLMTTLLAYALLHPQGIFPSGWKLAVEQARFFEHSLGAFGGLLFLFVAACFLIDPWPAVADVFARTTMDMLTQLVPQSRSISPEVKYRVIVGLLVIVSLATVFFNQPGTMILISGVLNYLAMPVVVASVAHLVHGPFRTALSPELRPGRVSWVLLWLSFWIYAVLAVSYLWARFF